MGADYNKSMKKTALVTIISFIFLMVSSAVAWALKFFEFENGWIVLSLGAALLVVSGIITIVLRRPPKLSAISLVMNAVTMGLCIRAWYILRGLDNNFLTMFLVCLACMAYLWIFYIISFIPFVERHYFIFFIGYLLLSAVAYILVMALTDTTFVSTFGYYMIIQIGFLFALCVEADTFSHLLRNLTLSTFSVFVVAALIAIICLAGDGLDLDFDFDSSFDGGAGKGKRKSLKDEQVIMD